MLPLVVPGEMVTAEHGEVIALQRERLHILRRQRVLFLRVSSGTPSLERSHHIIDACARAAARSALDDARHWRDLLGQVRLLHEHAQASRKAPEADSAAAAAAAPSAASVGKRSFTRPFNA